jgi:hypothetical protein
MNGGAEDRLVEQFVVGIVEAQAGKEELQGQLRVCHFGFPRS